MQRWTAGWLTGILLMMATGCTASQAPSLLQACRVEGDTKLLPDMTKAEICVRFLATMDATLTTMAERPNSRAGWQFVLRFAPPGEAIAIMSHSDVTHPIDIQISVSDRPLGSYVIDQLGDAAARRIAATS
jgi:hypothetical protein